MATQTNSSTPTVPGAEADALAIGRIRNSRVRSKPPIPAWVLKVTMAVTGIIFALFVLVHMVGNLKVYQGAEAFNAYASWLRWAFYPLLPYEGLLWILRFVLIIALVAHVVAALMLYARARRSRGPHRRKAMTRSLTTFSGRTMLVTGIVLLGFIAFHIMDLTLGTPGAAPDEFLAPTTEQAFAYQNLIASFERPLASAFYIIALLALFFHLAHGLWIAVNDLGTTGKRGRAIGAAVAGIVALAVLLGNLLIPVAVLLGVLS